VTGSGAIVGPNALFTVVSNGVPEGGNTFGLMLLALASFFVVRRMLPVPSQKLADRS
jgi:Na+-transporting NADH:ubiquinone oxidoreductase subunit NqrD